MKTPATGGRVPGSSSGAREGGGRGRREDWDKWRRGERGGGEGDALEGNL